MARETDRWRLDRTGTGSGYYSRGYLLLTTDDRLMGELTASDSGLLFTCVETFSVSATRL
jgi:hypothetical protein